MCGRLQLDSFDSDIEGQTTYKPGARIALLISSQVP